MDAMPPALAHAAPSWREERRRDRLAAAQIAREDVAARSGAATAKDEARARLRREERQARAADKRAARKQRAARWDARAAWLRGHVVDLLFVPVITVPGVLAWTAMAAYGSVVFGPAGVALPVFSEGAMWAFAGATTITRKRSPERPLWHLRLGTVVFAGFGAALNFAHGLAAASAVTGAVMALVSVAGVVAHQLITAGPRRARAERASARAGRAAVRRENAIRKAALRCTVAVLDADGGVRLVHKPGTVALTRRWHGRASLREVPQGREAEPQAALPGVPPLALSWPRPAPVVQAPASATESAIAGPAWKATPKATGEPSRSAAKEPPAEPSPAKRPAVAHVNKSQEAERARAEYRKSARRGEPLTDRALGEMFGKSRTWGASRIREAEAGPHLATRTG